MRHWKTSEFKVRVDCRMKFFVLFTIFLGSVWAKRDVTLDKRQFDFSDDCRDSLTKWIDDCFFSFNDLPSFCEEGGCAERFYNIDDDCDFGNDTIDNFFPEDFFDQACTVNIDPDGDIQYCAKLFEQRKELNTLFCDGEDCLDTDCTTLQEYNKKWGCCLDTVFDAVNDSLSESLNISGNFLTDLYEECNIEDPGFCEDAFKEDPTDKSKTTDSTDRTDTASQSGSGAITVHVTAVGYLLLAVYLVTIFIS